MNATSRRERVARLVELSQRIAEEIADIEREIQAEMNATSRAKNAARAANLRIPRRKVALCGTDGGYYRHRRTLKEPACDACKLAHRVSEALRQQEARARNGVAA